MPTLEMDSLSVAIGTRSKSIRGLCGFAISLFTARDFTPIASGARRCDSRAIMISLPCWYYDAVGFAFERLSIGDKNLCGADSLQRESRDTPLHVDLLCVKPATKVSS